jgi:hypothetical protein
MAIRNNKEENYVINGSIDNVRLIVLQALQAGGFSSIEDNKVVNQISANYKKMTVWGNIKITLEENESRVKVNAVSTANVDNIYALLSSPTQKILNIFKENIKYRAI